MPPSSNEALERPARLNVPIFQIDAFTSRVFAGNPAAVCPLERWLAADVLQSIAAENNLAETAFIVARPDADYDIRWFTPSVEVQLCGHATLASAHVVFEELQPARSSVVFHSPSGPLPVSKNGHILTLDFPKRSYDAVAPPEILTRALGQPASEAYFSVENYMLVYGHADHVRRLSPQFSLLRSVEALGFIVTAPGEQSDFVSRFFAPAAGIDEDPVTGSAHCTLAPYWAQRLGKKHLHALQVSKRGGELFCDVRPSRVLIGGSVARYLAGTISI
jgi:PhzF family phenazine biosynthesis protein